MTMHRWFPYGWMGESRVQFGLKLEPSCMLVEEYYLYSEIQLCLLEPQ